MNWKVTSASAGDDKCEGRLKWPQNFRVMKKIDLLDMSFKIIYILNLTPSKI